MSDRHSPESLIDIARIKRSASARNADRHRPESAPGGVFTREELQKRLWPDTFVDVDHNLNTAINKIREVLGDSSENPRFVETLPRMGYRFIAPVEDTHISSGLPSSKMPVQQRSWILRLTIPFLSILQLAAVGVFVFKRIKSPASSIQRTLTRLTFDEGLQIDASWSPDGGFLAYSSDRGGKFDIWVQQARYRRTRNSIGNHPRNFQTVWRCVGKRR